MYDVFVIWKGSIIRQIYAKSIPSLHFIGAHEL